MIVDLQSQLRELCAEIEEDQGPLTKDEVRARALHSMPENRPSRTLVVPRRSWLVFAAAAAFVLIAIGGVGLILRTDATDPAADPSEDTFVETPDPTTTDPISGATTSRTLSVTVSGVSGHMGDHLAAVLYEGAELTELDRDAMGGLWATISDDDFTMTGVIREPAEPGVGPFPFVSDAALDLEPGEYTLVIWVDTEVNPVDRWVPINTDDRGLFGCQMAFEVGSDLQATLTVDVDLHPDGWNIDCSTGRALPGTASVDPVTPVDSMPPVTGVGEGQTIQVTLSGLSGHAGDELGVVLYEGGNLTDLNRAVVGGFGSRVTSDEYTTTEVMRQPGSLGIGRYPFVTAEALTVEPGEYTLVVWVDTGLPVDLWVPYNTDGLGLFGCQMAFEVGDDPQTNVALTADLHPNGWNIKCDTGQALPGTNSDDGIAPPEFQQASSMPEVTGLGDGQTVSVTVSGLSGYAGQHLAGVLYEGGQLNDPTTHAAGGFWSLVSSDDYTTTEVIREPEDPGVGRYPFVSAEALTVKPGEYTLVVWVDFALNTDDRWVPINTDGQGLFGCQMVFEVGNESQTAVSVTPDLHPDGWDVDC